MQNDFNSTQDEHWVIWNGSYGIVDTVTIERTSVYSGTTFAWLNEPYEMVGPFNLDDLKSSGSLQFEACLLMSAQKWQDDQVFLRQESIKLKREAMARAQAQQARFNQRRQAASESGGPLDERTLRASLQLPAEGRLNALQIKTADRRLAQRTHPDQGGNQEDFVRVTQARDTLLKQVGE